LKTACCIIFLLLCPWAISSKSMTDLTFSLRDLTSLMLTSASKSAEQTSLSRALSTSSLMTVALLRLCKALVIFLPRSAKTDIYPDITRGSNPTEFFAPPLLSIYFLIEIMCGFLQVIYMLKLCVFTMFNLEITQTSRISFIKSR